MEPGVKENLVPRNLVTKHKVDSAKMKPKLDAEAEKE
jgi:hypothetical protein